jgi:formamidopyrimidine-DNA glycosylase
MPELPELELLRRELERDVGDRRVKAVEIPVAAIAKHPARKAMVAALDGVKLSGVTRRGTLISFGLEEGNELILTLGDRTRLTRNQAKEDNAPGTAAVISFTQGSQLRIVDPKKEAKLELVSAEELPELHPELSSLGIDAVDEPISWTQFGEQLLRRDGRLKSVLMDPAFIVGIGPMYSDEILFHAGLRYDRQAQSLSAQEIRRLYRAVVETIHEALKYGGTTLGPDGWVGVSGKPGEYQDSLAVYKRDGEMSPRARGPIVKTRFGSGYTYYCEQTQV